VPCPFIGIKPCLGFWKGIFCDKVLIAKSHPTGWDFGEGIDKETGFGARNPVSWDTIKKKI